MLYGSIIDIKNILNRYVNMINDVREKMRDVLIIGSGPAGITAAADGAAAATAAARYILEHYQ